MLTPQEVAEHAFAKSAFGGYNMTMVDEFLDELTDDYTALYKENAALKTKMKTLAETVEAYRATEDSMRSALLAAQKMASNMVSEAEEKKETLLADAEMEARAKIGALHDEIVYEQKRLNAIKASTQNFIAQTRAVCQAQLEQLQNLPDLTPEEIEQTTKEAKIERDAVADIAALGEKIVASYEQRGGEAEKVAADETMRYTPAKAAAAAAPEQGTPARPAAESGTFHDESTKPIRLDELKFGRNYNAENDE